MGMDGLFFGRLDYPDIRNGLVDQPCLERDS